MSTNQVDLQEVIKKEREEIANRRELVFNENSVSSENLTALSLSGGGIRSACFSLGLLEGLDQLPYPVSPEGKSKCAARRARGNHLELFDYLSSVSGGSYAAGHLATAMLSPKTTPEQKAIEESDSSGNDRSSDGGCEWFGKVSLTSKTIPGWLWGMGVWFLGVAFQLLKTVSLLLVLLTLVAFGMRILDAPDTMRFCNVLGLDSDVKRGLAPFGFTLWFFLVAYAIHVSKWRKHLTPIWTLFTAIIVTLYVFIVWSTHDEYPRLTAPLSFLTHYWFLMALTVPVVAVLLAILLIRSAKGIFASFGSRATGEQAEEGRPGGTFSDWLLTKLHKVPLIPMLFQRLSKLLELSLSLVSRLRSNPVASWLLSKVRSAYELFLHHAKWLYEVLLSKPRKVLLIPMLALLFCLAGLVRTGDIYLAPPHDPSERLLEEQLQKSRELSEVGTWVYRLALSALATTSLVFLFPKSLFRSVRKVEEHQASQNKSSGWLQLRARGWKTIFSVVIFLCSYGFVLLVIFVLFGLVVGENVSRYFEWRENVPLAALHPSDFRDSDRAWERIKRDADEFERPNLPRPPWGNIASRLMDVRQRTAKDETGREVDLSMEREMGLATKIRILESQPWAIRLVPLSGLINLRSAWTNQTHDPGCSGKDLYDAKFDESRLQVLLTRRIAEDVLSDPKLYRDLPTFEQAFPPDGRDESQRKSELRAWNRYLEQARFLEKIEPSWGKTEAAIRNNNRDALRLYLGDLMRDRHDKVVFASIVWAEDQWTRIRIVLIAGLFWLLCCAVDVNTFSLQRFYRGHVIDGWVKIQEKEEVERWLYETAPTYRGWEFQNSDRCAGENAGPMKRRSPLLLFNATLEGNRSLGDEPCLTEHIFTFSPIASGSGETKYWLNGPDGRNGLERRSFLDIGNIVATSGAFLSPGNVANPALSAILHLLNIQTGYWARDPNAYEKRSLFESLKFHMFQSLGIDCEKDSRYMLTDGAHAEGLGLYVLFQRRCSLIVASDCSQEDSSEKAVRRFDALIQVLQQARVDGIEVGPFLSSRAYLHWLDSGWFAQDGGDRKDCLRARTTGLDLVRPKEKESDRPKEKDSEKDRASAPAPPETNGKALSPAGREAADDGARFAQEHYVFAQIVYPGGSRGLLVYLRPSLTGDEGDSLLHGVADSRFPDDDPLDQFYTPMKMSTYRLLGRHIAEELMHDPVMRRALSSIIAGGPATEAPTHRKDSSIKATCDSYCGVMDSCGADKPCVWNHQRMFRPPVQTGG